MRLTIIILLLSLYSIGDAQLKKINAETIIQQVTIFSSGARVVRAGTVNIPAGRSEISFSGLSNQLDQETVQLKAEADLTLLAVQTLKDFLSERNIEQEERGFIDGINSLKDKMDLDQKRLDVCKNEEGMLFKNQAISGQAGVKTAELKEALELQSQRLTDLYEHELEIQKRILLEQRELDINKAQMEEISKKKDSASYIVTALIENKEAKMVNFQLSYNVKDAGWYPTYDVRVTEINEPVSILMNANVFQRSGETWKNITLELSSGSPKDNATPSELQPWMLGFYDPSVSETNLGVAGEISGRVTDENGEPITGGTVSVKNSKVGATTDKNGYFKLLKAPRNAILSITSVGYQAQEILGAFGYIRVSLRQMVSQLSEVVVTGYSAQGSVAGIDSRDYKSNKTESIHIVSVGTRYQPTTTIYKIHDRYTLPSDGKTTTIGIKQMDIPATYDYYSTPKTDAKAFLTAKIINWRELDLQSGEVNLYYEGTYLGKTYLDLASFSDTLSLSLGEDNGIKVSRELVKEYRTKRFFGSSRTDSRRYEISVLNSKRVPVKITILDQIPVSVTKEINVEDAKAAEGQVDRETGIATWNFVMTPGQEKKLNIGYSVKYPKDRILYLE